MKRERIQEALGIGLAIILMLLLFVWLPATTESDQYDYLYHDRN